MRAAIAAADVGDEQRGLDPTTNALQERVAELLGFPAAVFLPSGTMCNEIALRLHARPGGDELLLDRTAHPVNSEAGGPAQVSGLMIRTLDGDGGVFTSDQLEAALRPVGNRYMPRSRVVSVEQTSNLGGGRVWPLETVREVLAVARRHGLRAHLDGARLMNAVVASGVSAADYAGGFDTAWLDFTKGLGAPVGAVLAGSRELIDEAWRWKQMLGGAFRQSGIVAAGCLYALDHNVHALGGRPRSRAAARGGACGAARRAARPGFGGDQHRDLRGRRRAGAGAADRGSRRAPGVRPATRPGGDAPRRVAGGRSSSRSKPSQPSSAELAVSLSR